VALLSWLLAEDEQALLVLTDQPIVITGTAAGDRLPRRDSAVLLAVRHGPGQLRLRVTARAGWAPSAFGCAGAFRSRLADDIEQLRRAGVLGRADRVVAQSLFADDSRGSSPSRGDVDLGSGDVWHRLSDLLSDGRVRGGQRVLLAATGAIRRVSYALVEVGAAHGGR
jgi:hypothetical protein